MIKFDNNQKPNFFIMKKNNSILEFSKERLSRVEKRNILGGDRTGSTNPPPPLEMDENGNPITSTTNGDGTAPDLPPPPPPITSNN